MLLKVPTQLCYSSITPKLFLITYYILHSVPRARLPELGRGQTRGCETKKKRGRELTAGGRKQINTKLFGDFLKFRIIAHSRKSNPPAYKSAHPLGRPERYRQEQTNIQIKNNNTAEQLEALESYRLRVKPRKQAVVNPSITLDRSKAYTYAYIDDRYSSLLRRNLHVGAAAKQQRAAGNVAETRIQYTVFIRYIPQLRS